MVYCLPIWSPRTMCRRAKVPGCLLDVDERQVVVVAQHRGGGHDDRLLGLVRVDVDVDVHALLEQAARVLGGDADRDRQGARVERRADVGHLAVDRLVEHRRVDLGGVAELDPADVLLVELADDPQRARVADREARGGVGLDGVADRDLARHHRAGDRRAQDRVTGLAAGERDVHLVVLDGGLGGVDVEGRLLQLLEGDRLVLVEVLVAGQDRLLGAEHRPGRAPGWR